MRRLIRPLLPQQEDSSVGWVALVWGVLIIGAAIVAGVLAP